MNGFSAEPGERTQGTAASTALFADLYPGSGSSQPRELVRFGSRLMVRRLTRRPRLTLRLLPFTKTATFTIRPPRRSIAATTRAIRASAMMAEQAGLSPEEKYAVIFYVREAFFQPSNPSQYVPVTDEYLATLPIALREALQAVRDTIKSVAPDMEERMSSGAPFFWYGGRRAVGLGAAGVDGV